MKHFWVVALLCSLPPCFIGFANAQDQTPEILSVSQVVVGAQRLDTSTLTSWASGQMLMTI